MLNASCFGKPPTHHKQRNASKVYGARLHKDGEWIYEVLDDYLPFRQDGRLACGGTTERDEIWAALLEKAYAKVLSRLCEERGGGGSAS